MKSIPFFSLLAALAMGVSAQPASAKIVCWTDDQGRRACGDVVPPEVLNRDLQIINPRGVVVETHKRPPTEAERQAQAEATLRATQDAESAKRSAAYDEFLLQTYSDVAELEAQGQRRLEVLDGRHRLAEKAVSDTEQALADLQLRAERLAAADRPVPERLKDQIVEFESTLEAHRKSLQGITEQRDNLIVRYAQDVARYQQLTEAEEP